MKFVFLPISLETLAFLLYNTMHIIRIKDKKYERGFNMGYNFTEIEKKWQNYWDEHKTFYTDVWDFSKPKFYALDMFPYQDKVFMLVTQKDILQQI